MPCPKILLKILQYSIPYKKQTERIFVDWMRLHPVITVWVLLIFGWLMTTMAVTTMVRLNARKSSEEVTQEKAEEMAELVSMHRQQTRQKQHFCQAHVP